MAPDEPVGVPDMTPVEALIARPAGRVGAIVYPVTVPVTVGERGDIATPTEKEPAPGYDSEEGAAGSTVIERLNAVEPPLLLAVTA